MWIRGIRGKLLRFLLLKTSQIAGKNNKRPKPENFKNVLFINTLAVGDLLVTVPSLYELSKTVDEIEVLTSATAAPFLETLPFLTKVHRIQTTDIASLPTYDGLIDCQDTYTTLNRFLLSHRIKSAWRVGVKRGGFVAWKFDELIEKNSEHMADYSKMLIEKCSNIPLIKSDFTWPVLKDGLSEWDSLKIKILELNNSYPKIAIHIPNKNILKRWPVEHFAKLTKLFHQHFEGRVNLCFTGVKEEQELINEVVSIDSKNSNSVNLAGKLSPSGLIEFLRESSLLITVDTSLFHLAAMTKTPVIGIFGPTLLFFWGPWASNQLAISLEKKCMPKSNLNLILPLEDQCCPYQINHCMSEITPDLVFKKCLLIL